MDDLGLNCSVCEEQFSEDRTPRNLGCGHSFCTQCITQILARDKKCPECREGFEATSAMDLVVNYPLLRMAHSLGPSSSSKLQTPGDRQPSTQSSQSEEPSAVPRRATSQPDAGECPNHGSPMYFRCMQCNVWVCETCLSTGHQNPPSGQCRTLPITQALREMKYSHIQTFRSKKQFAEKLKRRIEKEMSASGALREQHSVTVANLLAMLQEVDIITAETENRKGESEERLQEVTDALKQLDLSDNKVNGANTIKELSTAMDGAMEHIAAAERCLVSDLHRQPPKVPSVVSFGKQNLRVVLEAGVAVSACLRDADGGGLRVAKITERDCLLHLHALHQTQDDIGGLVIPYETVRQLLPREFPSIFLNVGWSGQVRGRVYVRMFGDTPRAQQALLLCSGERGPSYKDTCFFKVENLNQPTETLCGGDYENNNGTGGRQLLNCHTSSYMYTTGVEAGLMAGWPSSEAHILGAFKFHLRNVPGQKTKTAFGMVTSGLETLRSAARRSPVAEARVVDCGLVIPM